MPLISTALAATNSDAANGILITAATLYLGPTVIALVRGHLSALAISVANLLLGWTGLGWVACLIWSLTGNTRDNAISAHKSALRQFKDESRADREELLLAPPRSNGITWLLGFSRAEWLIIGAGAIAIAAIIAVAAFA